jgi:hypothetical protein
MSFSIKSLVQELFYEPVGNAVGDVGRDDVTRTPLANSCPKPRPTLHEVIALDELESPALRAGVRYWRQLCGERRFPGREDLNPRGMAKLLRNTELVSVLDGGDDYEYRIVGDAVACAYGGSFQNHRLSDF